MNLDLSPVTVNLGKEQRERLERAARAKALKLSSFLRMIAEDYLTRNPEPEKEQ